MWTEIGLYFGIENGNTYMHRIEAGANHPGRLPVDGTVKTIPMDLDECRVWVYWNETEGMSGETAMSLTKILWRNGDLLPIQTGFEIAYRVEPSETTLERWTNPKAIEYQCVEFSQALAGASVMFGPCSSAGSWRIRHALCNASKGF